MTHFRRTNPEHLAYMKTYMVQYRKDNPEKIREHALIKRSRPGWKAKAAIYGRRSMLKMKYGLTEAQVIARLEAQGCRCLICHTSLTFMTLRIDHCHATGRVRGLLCDPCNIGLGNFKDDTARLRKAADYLDESTTL
jgi:hypothetical protein